MTCSGAPGDPCAANSAHPVFGAPAATKVVDRQGKVEKRLLLCQSIRSIGSIALRRPTIGGAPHAPAAGEAQPDARSELNRLWQSAATTEPRCTDGGRSSAPPARHRLA
ncbi:hypothetical protein MRX96_059325 [Rhipicephalus microplus]